MSKAKRKAKLNYQQVLFVNLKSYSLDKATTEDNKKVAKSLLNWYYANNSFTSAQTALIKKLTYKPKKVAKPKKHYLYAISNGEQVKLGMSSNPKKRLATLQTSSPQDLVLLWDYYVATSSSEAAKIEKLLHRACKKHHVRGEWFSMGCMEMVNSFNPNKKHCAKWEFAKLVSVDKKRRNGILNFTVETIRRTKVTGEMVRAWSQKEAKELYQIEIKKMLDDGEVVLLSKA